MIEFYYMFVLDTTLFWSKIWFMPHMWRKYGVNEGVGLKIKKMKKQKNPPFHLLVLEAPDSQETRGLLVHAVLEAQNHNKNNRIAKRILPMEIRKVYSFIS